MNRKLIRTTALLFVIAALMAAPIASRGEHDGKLQILILGDSTAECSIPRKLVPEGPHLEDVIRQLLAAEGDLPPCNVINVALSGEFIHRLLDTGRYDKVASKLPGLDYILVRYGLNDVARRENFDVNFPQDFHKLIARLRKDHPAATIIPMTVIPMAFNPKTEVGQTGMSVSQSTSVFGLKAEGEDTASKRINDLVRRVAEEEKLPLFDIYPRYYEELKKGPNMLNYRRFPLAKIPEKYREFVKPFVANEKEPKVVVMDNRLDAHFGNLPGWYGDRHPNLAGYHVIGDETAKFLAPMIRAKLGKAKPASGGKE
ncbi:MAG: SGNH/GDSL hydrolase family protein [Verrucomicrobia bacterium]|nr:SGNH/GDSL hydrolase family protein [Verrucomicrobiota bacterium]